ncbi:MAG: TRAP transporter small permease [Rubrivivax sp.]|nr:TRAP transporter small permease [Rubrivivax sp.]
MKRVPVALEEGIAVACMALLVLITLGNVLTRYLTDESFAWTEEISIFLMVVMTLAGAAAAAARDGHIRIEYFYERGSAARQHSLRIVAGCAMGLLFLVLAVLFTRMVADEFRYGESSMGLNIPRWWFTALSPPLCLLVALRSFGVAWRAARDEGDGGGDAGGRDEGSRAQEPREAARG